MQSRGQELPVSTAERGGERPGEGHRVPSVYVGSGLALWPQGPVTSLGSPQAYSGVQFLPQEGLQRLWNGVGKGVLPAKLKPAGGSPASGAKPYLAPLPTCPGPLRTLRLCQALSVLLLGLYQGV